MLKEKLLGTNTTAEFRKLAEGLSAKDMDEETLRHFEIIGRAPRGPEYNPMIHEEAGPI